MTGVVGRAVTLSCPDLSSDTIISGDMVAIKEWFRGSNSNPEAKVAKLMTRGGQVKHKYTIDERTGIDTMDGDLIIQNVTLEDAGLYTCYLSGSKAQNIQLNVVLGKMIGPYVDVKYALTKQMMRNIRLVHSCHLLACRVSYDKYIANRTAAAQRKQMMK